MTVTVTWMRGALPLLLLLSIGCKPSDSKVAPTKVSSAEGTTPAGSDSASGLLLSAAGVELTVPRTWQLLVEDDPNFALAFADEARSSHVPVCSIELRRQGPGPLPEGAREQDGIWEYQRGAQRGRLRTLAGPDGATIVVHCRAARTMRGWPQLEDAMASIRETGAVELSRVRGAPEQSAVVELCTGSPARLTTVCARRADGAVFCGASSGDSLTRVALPRPAVQISCVGTSGCARDAEGGVACWEAGGEAQPVPDSSGARQIVDQQIVDGSGRLLRRELGVHELRPLDDPALRLTEVELVLPGTHANDGCVLRSGEVWCWDQQPPREMALGFVATDLNGASELRRFGDRFCVATPNGRWTCADPAKQRYQADRCATRACGCSLIGASRFSCEDQPIDPIDARPLGRLSDVVVVADPCAVLGDGSVVCRGALAGAGPAADPGVVHTLALRE